MYGTDQILDEAYSSHHLSDEGSLSECERVWSGVKDVYETARDCDYNSQDENAWSKDVVRPILQWADRSDLLYKVLGLYDPLQSPQYATVMLLTIVVTRKSQNVYPDYLS